jgi:uncharacterized coiled-coil protein SlyX
MLVLIAELNQQVADLRDQLAALTRQLQRANPPW